MKLFLKILLGVIAVFIIIQFLPVDTENPQVITEPDWDTPKTKELVRRLCFDCHSNETTWPWYSKIAPVSWIIASHVEDGRKELNFSEDKEFDVKEIIEEFSEGKMPLRMYKDFHPETSITNEDSLLFVEGLIKTLGK